MSKETTMLNSPFKTIWLVGATISTYLFNEYLQSPYTLISTIGAFILTAMLIFMLSEAEKSQEKSL